MVLIVTKFGIYATQIYNTHSPPDINEAFRCGTSKNKRKKKEFKIQQQNMLPSHNKQPPITLICFIMIIIVHSIFTLVNVAECIVVDHVRFLVRKSSRPQTTYAFAGESGLLSCHYLMDKDKDEDVRQITWFKDGQQVFRELKGGPGLEILSPKFKGHVEFDSFGHTIYIKDMTIDMHGRYTCHIKTDIGDSHNEVNVVVIRPNACSEKDWQTYPIQHECKEVIELHCPGMFPRPVPSCGLWNPRIHKFIKSMMVHINENPDTTFTVSYSGVFKIEDKGENFHKYDGNISFKCDLSVPDTDYKFSIEYPLFNYKDGCFENPLDYIEQLRSNYTRRAASIIMEHRGLVNIDSDIEILSSPLSYTIAGPKNCWGKPRHKSLAKISCLNLHTQLSGISELECTDQGWRPRSPHSDTPGNNNKKHNTPERVIYSGPPNRLTGTHRSYGKENNKQMLHSERATTKIRPRQDKMVELEMEDTPFGEQQIVPLSSPNQDIDTMDSFRKINNKFNEIENDETSSGRGGKPVISIDISHLPTCLSKITSRSSTLNEGASSIDILAAQPSNTGSSNIFPTTGTYFLATMNSVLYLFYFKYSNSVI